MKKAEYIKKYGTEAYIRKAYRPKYQVAALRKEKKIVPKPAAVARQPRGLSEYQADVAHYRKLHPKSSFKNAKAKIRTYRKWSRRRAFHKYPARVQRYIKATYDKGRESGKISAERDLIEWVGKS